MPQVTRTTNDVIVNSLFLLGELGVGETPDNFMLQTGLELINELMDKFAADSIYIPFLTTIDFNFVVGKDTYSVSDMVPSDIRQDRIVDLSFANYFVPASGATSGSVPVSSTFTSDLNTNLLTLATTSAFHTNTPVVLSTNGVLPAPLIAGVTYWTINVSPTELLLATSSSNALNGIFIDLTGAGNGIHFITATTFPLNPALGTLCYPLRIINKATYWNIVRQTNLLARPGFIFLDKQPQESLITVYPVPDQPYAAKIQVKVMINDLSNMETLVELPPNYYGFLKYALARKFLAYYPSGNWPQQNEDEYQDYYNTFKNCNETDLTIRPSVTLTAPEPFYWPNILSF